LLLEKKGRPDPNRSKKSLSATQPEKETLPPKAPKQKKSARGGEPKTKNPTNRRTRAVYLC